MNQKQQIEKNTTDIETIKQEITTIRQNHLHHIEKDLEKQSKLIEKIDARVWWILGLLVASTVIGMIGG